MVAFGSRSAGGRAGAGRRPARSPRRRCRRRAATSPRPAAERVAVGTGTGARRPRRASTSTKPGPPSASGRQHSRRRPGAGASRRPSPAAASTAVSVPANLSGQTSTRTDAESATSQRAAPGGRRQRAWDDERRDDGLLNRPRTATALLLLGRGTDPDSERGVDCPGDLPAPSDPDLVERARAAKAALGDRVFVLGHHYQRDEVIQFADVTGDSFKLAREAAARPDAEFIVFCGVHFMAESADILTTDAQRVVLPDLAAGCSMADMAVLGQVEACLGPADRAGHRRDDRPGHLHELLRRHQGLRRAPRRRGLHLVERQARPGRGPSSGASKVLFLPDQHLGRNTAVLELGLSLDDCVLYDPHKPSGGLTAEQLRDAKMILWRGHCSVHGRFTLDYVERGARAGARGQRAGAPGVPARGGHRGRLRRLDRVHHPHHRGRAGRLGVGGRHRAEPGTPAGQRRTRTSRSCSSTRPSATAPR